MLSSKSDFPNHRLSDSYTLPTGVNGFGPIYSTLLGCIE
jgi:hypothetical protein